MSGDPIANELGNLLCSRVVDFRRAARIVSDVLQRGAVRIGIRRGSRGPIEERQPRGAVQRCHLAPGKRGDRNPLQKHGHFGERRRPFTRIAETHVLPLPFRERLAPVAIVPPLEKRSKDEDEHENDERNQSPKPSPAQAATTAPAEAR